MRGGKKKKHPDLGVAIHTCDGTARDLEAEKSVPGHPWAHERPGFLETTTKINAEGNHRVVLLQLLVKCYIYIYHMGWLILITNLTGSVVTTEARKALHMPVGNYHE